MDDKTTSSRNEKYSDILNKRLTYLQNRLDIDPLQMAIAIQEGRVEMEYREALIISAHQHIAPRKIVWAQNKPESYQFRKIKADYKQVWMFPGQGAQYAGMARSLYAGNRIFKQAVDACCEYFREHLEQDLRPLIFGVGKELEANEALKQIGFINLQLFGQQEAYEQQYQTRILCSIERRAKQLGFQLVKMPTPA